LYAMTGESDAEGLEWWQALLIAVGCAVVVGLTVAGCVALVGSLKSAGAVKFPWTSTAVAARNVSKPVSPLEFQVMDQQRDR